MNSGVSSTESSLHAKAVPVMAVVTWAYDEAVRHTSYGLLAEAMG